jgi:hypothetical protein
VAKGKPAKQLKDALLKLYRLKFEVPAMVYISTDDPRLK